MSFIKKYFKWILLSVFIIVFAMVAMVFLEPEIHVFDLKIYEFVSSFRGLFLTEVFKTVSYFSSAPFLIVLSIALFFVFKNKKYAILSLGNLIFVVLMNQLLKVIISRPRPIDWMIVEESGFSFPSGHAMVSMAFYGMVIYLLWQTNLSRKLKKVWTFILALLILLVGLSRIYLGVHYASDVIAGFTLSLSYLIVATSVVGYYLKK